MNANYRLGLHTHCDDMTLFRQTKIHFMR